MHKKVTLAVSVALIATATGSTMSNAVSEQDPVAQQSQSRVLKRIAPVADKPYKEFTPGTHQLSVARTEIADSEESIYIVQLEEEPVASKHDISSIDSAGSQLVQSGRRGNYAATATTALTSPAATAKQYASELRSQQEQFLRRAEATMGSIKPVARYQYALNGMAIKLTAAQAKEMAALPGIKHIEKDRRYYLNTDTGPLIIGAAPVWEGSVTDSGLGRQGEGIVIGIMDTGINSDHPSFADIGADGYNHANPLGSGVYLGDCAANSPSLCNDKLIGVYSYSQIIDAYSDDTVFQGRSLTPGEDYNGHGSHTAATAAGNVLFDVPEVLPEHNTNTSDGVPTGFVYPRLSGVAPHANIVSYQVCEPGNAGDTYAGCLGAPMVAAIEDAIKSGVVDVINFSISGGDYPWTGALNAAWLSARNAGIFVVHSAGNDGPAPFSTDKHAPWITAVAASTHGRSIQYEKSITNFSGGTFTPSPIPGTSNTGGITAPIVYAGDYTNPNDVNNDPGQCLESFPAGTFSGEIVVCDRGSIARVDKAVNVAEGGAGGFVLANVEGGETNLANDNYVVPGIHINAADGTRLRNWLASGSGHTATITAAEGRLINDSDSTDNTAGFSSRGPNGSISTLSPSLTAPGVDIYAAYADEQYGQDESGSAPADYAYLSGTSMASPHVAGAAALIRQEKPSWTPDNIRSALMMTATTDVRKEDGDTAADWFDIGSGRIQVNLAVQSGLVMDESAANYDAADPRQGGDPRTLNLPSVTDNNCVGLCSWTRTVTATKAGTWSATGIAIDPGLTVTVSPESFTLSAGESQQLTITMDAFNAPSERWAFGYVNLTSPVSPPLHLPVSVIPSNGNFPDALNFVSHRDADSRLLRDMMAMEISDFNVKAYGLIPLTMIPATVTQDSANSAFLDDLNDGLFIYDIQIPADSLRLVATTEQASAPDLDLYVVHDFNNDGIPTENEIVAASASANADEYVSIDTPEAGRYWLIVQNWTASSPTARDTFNLGFAVVDDTTSNNLSVDVPTSVPQLTKFDMRILWELDQPQRQQRYVGALVLGTDDANPTNLGTIPVDIVRGENDVMLQSQMTGPPMPNQQRDYTISVLPNFTTEDREYEISLTLVEGASIVEGSVGDAATVDGNTIRWSVTQPSRLSLNPSYRISTNENDTQCKNPELGQGSGGYIDLAALGYSPSTLTGDSVTDTYMAKANLLGQIFSSITVTDDGFISFSENMGMQPWHNQLMPDVSQPNGIVAPFWRDLLLDGNTGAVVTVAATENDDVTVVEWDNARFPFSLYGIQNDYADVADFEVVFNNNAAEGEPDIIFSYDNVIHDFVPPVSVGYEGVNGERGTTLLYSPYFESQNPAIGNVRNAIFNGKQICFFNNGSFGERASLPFTIKVDDTAAADELIISTTSQVVNIPGTRIETVNLRDQIHPDTAPQVTIAGTTQASLTVIEGERLVLPGEVTDANEDVVSVLWEQIGGPVATLTKATTANAELLAPEVTEDQVIRLQLTAVDASGNRNQATAEVTVKNNLPPTLSVAAPTNVTAGSSITINATATDPEGDNVAITINGVAGNTFNTRAPTSGSTSTMSFTVTASDGLNTVTETVTVRINPQRSSGGGGGGTLGSFALLLLAAVYLRRGKQR